MKYLNSQEISKKWNVSERTVRDYCANGRVAGAILNGKIWAIPENAEKPLRATRHLIKKENLLTLLKREKDNKISNGLYRILQIEMTYNSNHIEGSELSHEETKYIFDFNNISFDNKKTINIDDIIETINHFRCIDLAIDSAKVKLTESLIKEFHFILKSNTSDSKKEWFKVGDYKLLDNEVSGFPTTPSSNVKEEMKNLLTWYNNLEKVKVEDIIEFHYRFEHIHPFQDGNGRVGRLIMLKECLKHDIIPILILDDNKKYYYRGFKEWVNDKAYLIDTCLYGQDILKKYLDDLNINILNI